MPPTGPASAGAKCCRTLGAAAFAAGAHFLRVARIKQHTPPRRQHTHTHLYSCHCCRCLQATAAANVLQHAAAFAQPSAGHSAVEPALSICAVYLTNSAAYVVAVLAALRLG